MDFNVQALKIITTYRTYNLYEYTFSTGLVVFACKVIYDVYKETNRLYYNVSTYKILIIFNTRFRNYFSS